MTAVVTHYINFPPDFEDRFWRKVEKTATCWLWRGAKTRDGYGTVATGERSARGYTKVISAHKAGYMLQHGVIAPGLHVMHSCDVKLCVRGEHLRAGTRKDNVRDMHAKGRQRFADRTGQSRAKVTRAQAEQVRILFASGLFSRQDLATRFGVRMKAIQEILQYKTWKKRENFMV